MYGSWVYNYLCKQCLSILKLWIRTPLRSQQGVLDTILCDKVCQWLVTGWWLSPGTLVCSTNKTDHHDIIDILLTVGLNTLTLLQLGSFIILRFLITNNNLHTKCTFLYNYLIKEIMVYYKCILKQWRRCLNSWPICICEISDIISP